MQKFTTLTSIAAPLPMVNVDTDMIIPKQFLKTIERTGLGKCLFNDLRFDDAGQEKKDFVLNKPPYRQAQILIAGDNFGCGSSREHAPWALLDFGIRCVVAPSFADIFYNNCFKNGILPIALPKEAVEELMAAADGSAEMSINLEEQHVLFANKKYKFDIDPFRKHCLLEGLDDIGLTLAQAKDIDNFETGQKEQQPWLYRG